MLLLLLLQVALVTPGVAATPGPVRQLDQDQVCDALPKCLGHAMPRLVCAWAYAQRLLAHQRKCSLQACCHCRYGFTADIVMLLTMHAHMRPATQLHIITCIDRHVYYYLLAALVNIVCCAVPYHAAGWGRKLMSALIGKTLQVAQLPPA
jgi:hypothetical protein